MQRIINILIGWIAFACLLVLGRTGSALDRRVSNEPVVLGDYVFLGCVLASIFFLQYALDRYLIPPSVFTKSQRNELLEGAQAGYRKTFFRGALGVSYFFLIAYVVGYLNPNASFSSERSTNWMVYSALFLILGMVGRARGIILHLAGKVTRPAQVPIQS